MTDDHPLLDLARTLITVRTRPTAPEMKLAFQQAMQQFAALVDGSSDPAPLTAVLVYDRGMHLPSALRQRAFERCFALGGKTPALLREYALHLLMFGYAEADGTVNGDTDAQIEALYAEADALEQAAQQEISRRR